MPRWARVACLSSCESQQAAHGIRPSNASVDDRASRSAERCQSAEVTLADSAKISPRDIILLIRRGSDPQTTQRSRASIAGIACLVSVGRTKLFTFGHVVRSVKRASQNRESRVIYNAHRSLHLHLARFSTEHRWVNFCVAHGCLTKFDLVGEIINSTSRRPDMLSPVRSA